MEYNRQLSLIAEQLMSHFGRGELLDKLKLSPSALDSILQAKGFACIFTIEDFMKKCGFNLVTLEHQRVDMNAVVRTLNNDKEVIPQRYRIYEHTNRLVQRSILNLVNYETVIDTLRYLQISPDFLSTDNGSKRVSTQLSYDMLEYLKARHSINTFSHIGAHIYQSYENTPFGNKFTDMSAKETYEVFLGDVASDLEKSHKYKLVKLTDKVAIIRKWLTEETESVVKPNRYIDDRITPNHENCNYSMGLAASITMLSRDKVTFPVTETRCIFAGHDFCEWQFDLTQPIAKQDIINGKANLDDAITIALNQ